MSRILKRKRRSSDSFVEDYAREGKKLKTEATIAPEGETENVEEEYLIWSSQISLLDFRDDAVAVAVSSRVGPSDSLDPVDLDCDTCSEASEPAEPLDNHLCEDCDDLPALESELDDSREIDDVILSPRSNPDVSSCDERVIPSEDLISSPVAGSLVETDFEDDLLEPNDDVDVDVDKGPKTAGKAVSFMGQLTPGSSICNFKTWNSKNSTWTNFRKVNQNNELYSPETDCPVPQLPWACREEFWQVMCRKDELSLETRDPEFFGFQQHLRPRMRVILLDWISEVAELFKLHRETYYLCVDYIDRYLSSVVNIPKSQLQLIGITCLFLASKMEEIYPPKIQQFAEVTDGACTETEIFAMEVAILKHLSWLLSPITINNWLEMMLQFIYQKLEKKNKNVLTPHFSSTLFKRLCQLLDLVTLDITSLRFSYGVLVAAAIYILVDPQLAISTSGLKKEILEPCVQWMSVYWKVLRKSHAAEMADVNNLLTDRSEIYFGDQHPELQTHNISMELYDEAQKQFELLASKDTLSTSCRTLTPPPSSSKSITYHNDEDLSR